MYTRPDKVHRRQETKKVNKTLQSLQMTGMTMGVTEPLEIPAKGATIKTSELCLSGLPRKGMPPRESEWLGNPMTDDG